MADKRIIIVGGGLAGLMAALKSAENGLQVDLFSLVPVKRSHSVCAQGGINGAVNTKGEGDSPAIHTYDTIKGGDFLGNQPPIKAMCEAAPRIINLLDRMGVPFSRTPEGLLDFRRFGGTLHHRTAFAGATTGQQLLYALDEQVRRFEAEGRITKYELWDFQGLVIEHEGTAQARCCGIVATHLHSMATRAFPASAVLIATGGPGMVFGKSTNSVINTGHAAAQCYVQGALYANGEFIQVHPTAIPGPDKDRLMSESARGEGGRVWVWGDSSKTMPHPDYPQETLRCGETGKPWYFLEEMYPKFGNLVPRDIATRAIFKVCVDQGLGIDGQYQVYLDVSHMGRAELDRKLGGILDIYEKFAGEDPHLKPMKIFPSVHYSMGGLYVRYEADAQGDMKLDSPLSMMTNVQGLYAAGEVEYQFHGANRLGANSLLSCIFAGQTVGSAAKAYIEGLKPQDPDPALLEAHRRRFEDRLANLREAKGPENPYRMHQELGQWMTENVTVVRENTKLQATLDHLDGMLERYNSRLSVPDGSGYGNSALFFAKDLGSMIELARVITKGALLRNESRGAHYKPEFPERLDEWTKTTLARHTPSGPEISYEAVDMRYHDPVKRNYR